MIRVYFDWNVYSNIRNKKNENFSQIKQFIEENKDSIFLIYSPAHLQDLSRSYFKSEAAKIETEKDLDFLGELTSNHCLQFNDRDKTVYRLYSSKRFFPKLFCK